MSELYLSMPKFYYKSLILMVFTIGLLYGCAEDTNRKNKQEDKKEEKKKKQNSNLFEIEGKVFSIPSPIQTAFLLKKSGAGYSSDLLNPTSNVVNYATKSRKALNLGVYGANLGYATIYDQTQDAISYMAVTKRISSELGISNLFDQAMIVRFESNLGDQDSLLALVSDAFKKADGFLKENKQNDLSVLILAGGWVETLHLATSLAGTTNNQDIQNRIGEQKITIKNLINLLLPYQKNTEVADILNQLNELKDLYSDIGFTYSFQESTTDEESKMTLINSESKVDMTEDQLQSIIKKVEEIRNTIIK